MQKQDHCGSSIQMNASIVYNIAKGRKVKDEVGVGRCQVMWAQRVYIAF